MGSLSRDYNENVKLHKGKPTPTKWNEKKKICRAEQEGTRKLRVNVFGILYALYL